MRRIFIDKHQRDLAIAFRKNLKEGRTGKISSLNKQVNPLKKGRTGYNSPLDNLNDLLKKGLSGTQKKYVSKIKDEWDDIIILEPCEFKKKIQEFDSIISNASMAQEKVGKDNFYELVVEAMRYDYVQKNIYPSYISQLGIKACVYCNAQYAFAASYGKDHFKNYQLDHWKPKSKFPFLCTTFFNLQPCCAHCNQKKNNRDAEFNLFIDDKNNLRPMSFSATENGIVEYLCSHEQDKIQIKFDCKDIKLKQNQEELFQITTQYQAHKDIVEELLWKSNIYNPTIQEIYNEIFKELGLVKSDFNRFIIGNYDTDEDIHKRPLSLMVQDIARQLNIIKD